MINHFLRHQWLQFRRSSSFERELGISIFIAFLAFFILLSIIALALAIPKLMGELPGITEPVSVMNQALVYYFIGEILIRYFLQKVPVLDIAPYLGLPIKRSTITNFLLGKSLLSVFNLISIILTLPFAIQILVPEYGAAGIIGWLAAIFFTSLFLHFFNILFKKKLEDIPLIWGILILLAGSNYILSRYYQVDLFEPLSTYLMITLNTPLLSVLNIIAVIAIAHLTIKFFKENLYLEEMGEGSNLSIEAYSDKLSFLGRSSLSNTLVLQEIKMIIRHKRTRSVVLISLLFLGYGLIFFGNDNYSEMRGIYIFIGVFLSGMFAINYGQFFWSWNTNQMDFFFTRPIAVHTWLKSRYNLLISSCVIFTILAMPYVYFGWDILFIVLAGGLYNIGINVPLMIRLSMWKPKPIDLNKGAFMNYQGTGAAQWLMAIPLILIPYVIYLPLNILFGHLAGISGIAVVGIIGFTLRDYFISLIVKKLYAVKYKLIKDLTL